MSGKNILVVALVPVALAIPVLLVKLVVRQSDPLLPLEHLRQYEVVTAEYYGVRLDEKASPRDVAYVLLRSIREGAHAAHAPKGQDQTNGLRQAREIQLATAAPGAILQRGQQLGYPMTEDMGPERFILNKVLSWSRMLTFYADAYDLEKRSTWLETVGPTAENATQATVRLQATRDAFGAQIIIGLIRESNRWRVHAVLLTAPAAASQPASLPRPAKPASAPAVVPAPAKPASAPATARSAAVPASVPAPAATTRASSK